MKGRRNSALHFFQKQALPFLKTGQTLRVKMKSLTMTFLAAPAIALVATTMTSCGCLDCNKEFRRVTRELSGPQPDPRVHGHPFKNHAPHSHPLRGNGLPPGHTHGSDGQH